MAINPSTNATMVGRVTAPDANYPYASSQDETVPGAGDGSPYFKARADDIFGLQQALLKAAGIVPSGNADTALVSEYLQSIIELAQGRATNYDESGVADVYVLDAQSDQQAPNSLFDGQIFDFIPGNTNAGASTVNPVTLGVKTIVNTSNGGELIAGERVKIRYRVSSGDFEIVAPSFSSEFISAEQVVTSGGSLTLAHGLPAAPKLLQARLICKTANLNYAVNDEVITAIDQSSSASANNFGLSVVPDGTNVNIRYASSSLILLNKTTGAGTAITNSSWRLIMRAW